MEELIKQLLARTERRIAFAGRSSEWLATAFRALQSNLFSWFISRYIDDIFADGRRLRLTTRSATNAARVGAIFQIEYQAQAGGILRGIAERMIRQQDYSREYFSLLGLPEPEARSALAIVMRTYGFDVAAGRIIPGGYLHGVLNSPALAQFVGQQIREGMAAGMGKREFIAKFRGAFVNPGGTGMLERHFNRFSHDLFQQFDRLNNIILAEAAGTNHFVYAGTAVEDSRAFCLRRLNRIYTTMEAVTWDEMDWKGKIPNVPVLQQLGGYGCQQVEMFITAEMATILEQQYGPINGYNALPAKKATV